MTATVRSPFAAPVLRSIACLLCGALFALCTWQVLAHGQLFRWDEELSDGMRAAAPPRTAAELLSDIGNMTVALPVLAAAMTLALWLTRGRGWRPVLCYASSMVVMALVVTGVKNWTDRTGPMGGGGFYPSGHAATTTVALGGALLVVAAWLSRALLVVAWTGVVVLSLGNGLGLVWRGYHWPLDVAASWCLSVLLLCSAAALARRGPPRASRRTPRRAASAPPASSASPPSDSSA
ncbi:phosphatase PAP2 family protein [Streptomyces diacarni]|uniref:phosphatase PAP2 family protein n=1 Tax=Streptomyces diacarni TaxID=2800381 RepID=UPI001FE95E8E|nr:phosphatase PAP2 family protein [Streptomyces diacarni]